MTLVGLEDGNIFVELTFVTYVDVILKLAVGISRFRADFKPEALANNISWLYLIKLALGVLLCEGCLAALICTLPFVLLNVMPF